jgi:hypothetical protein
VNARVSLTSFEMVIAGIVGVRRHAQVVGGTHRSPVAATHDVWGNNCEGACGEMAFAKWANVYWNGSVATFKTSGDVGGFEVRTRRRPTYQLLVRDCDPSDRIYVLVRGEAPDFEIVGWMSGADAKRREWLQSYGGGTPAYFVPDAALHPIEELVRR